MPNRSAERVAQIFNLLYRRFAIGRQSLVDITVLQGRTAAPEVQQVENLRYSPDAESGRSALLKICATRQASLAYEIFGLR